MFQPGPNGRTALGLDFDGAVHQFSGGGGTSDAQGRGTSTSNELFLDTGDFVEAILFWDDPWGASTNDYDLYLLDQAGNIVAFSIAEQGSFVGTPREQFVYQNGGPPGLFRLVVQNFEDTAERRTLELFVFGCPTAARSQQHAQLQYTGQQHAGAERRGRRRDLAGCLGGG